MGSLKTQLISDTHNSHRLMNIDESCDMIVHAGDSTNDYLQIYNEQEFRNFVDWYGDLNIQHKILIAGNHDQWATKKYNKDIVKEKGIIYLEDSHVTIDGRVILGSPWSPTFGTWHFMKSRDKLGTFWDKLLFEGIDLLVTHTPPKGILDLSEDRLNRLEFCGCNGLKKAVEKYKPKHHVFGHIHNRGDIINFGERNINDTRFYNASAIKDGDKTKIPVNPNGIIINL